MQVSRPVFEAITNLLAADPATLGAVTAMHVHLSKQNFAPLLDTVLADFLEATFTGSAALNAGTGTQPVYYDLLDGVLTLQLLEPAGGWHWECTVTPASPETIYGYYVTDTADAVLLGCGLLPTPLTVALAGQGLDLPNIVLKFSPTSPY